MGYFLPVAVALRERGHDVHFVVTQTGQAARLLVKAQFSWMQAPTSAEQPTQNGHPPLSYADIMLRFGYHNCDDLNGLVTGWREIFKLTQTDLLIADHSPTALLAARSLTLPSMLYGSGFFIPPKQTPLPNMRPWIAIPDNKLAAIEAIVLNNINQVLTLHGQPSLLVLAELFEVAEDTILSFPELDHYPHRGPAKYWGVIPGAGHGVIPEWPAMPGQRVFAYLRPEVRHLEATLIALQELGLPTVVYCPGLTEDIKERFSAPFIHFSVSMLDMATITREADAVVSYAAYASTVSFLLSGKPTLMLPFHLEQFLFARRVEQMGAGLLVDPEQPATDLLQKLRRVLFDPLFAGNAQAFARKYAAFPQEVVVANLVRRIEELCA
jgi:UDP:flavonoid glycosyltransferase YjiC (YdhE family)